MSEITKDYVKFVDAKLQEDVLFSIAAVLGIETSHGKYCLAVKLAEAKLLDDKQKDYGPNNIIEIGLLGIVSRINDKRARADNLLKKRVEELSKNLPVSQTANESLADTFLDISNYGTIASMVERKLWPAS